MNSFVQFRTDEISKIKAINICEQLGIDLPTYLRMCILKLVQNNGIPFLIGCKRKSSNNSYKKASDIAKQNGIQDMTLEEINFEIKKSRNS